LSAIQNDKKQKVIRVSSWRGEGRREKMRAMGMAKMLPTVPGAKGENPAPKPLARIKTMRFINKGPRILNSGEIGR
jgi:hypothetical protein